MRSIRVSMYVLWMIFHGHESIIATSAFAPITTTTIPSQQQQKLSNILSISINKQKKTPSNRESYFNRNNVSIFGASNFLPFTKPVLLSSSIAAGLACRGGAAAAAATAAAVNFSREGYHLQVLAGYSTVTALVMNSALRLFSSTKFVTNEDKDDSKRIKYWEALFTAVISLCIVSGAFTAVLFNILGIYSKSALGMSNDVGYLKFQSATARYATWGFRCFLTSLGSFVISFILSLYSRMTKDDNRIGKTIVIGSLLLALLGAYHIKVVLNLATEHIFAPMMTT